ncbi:hypothetical protein [Clostridium butyricum]|uniref:hypothetical protein n=1 Tax=Clostridium butyricum TaxID=1492 RepID=UPI0013D81277|nr:hypothetical protein [Clostridium butyricum]MCQ2016788.1 hypothetical protein [Clostridium butyricum]MCQ2023111.1 hypothetical protein [Clostridium butyricum]NFB69558.1 hypothetical protein [Clostridium butyricum]NFB90387.1 hypothetical protein [Clostridium butyricum]UTY54146.1 hypothetical protein HNS01_13955 [Clostridium butyricum]
MISSSIKEKFKSIGYKDIKETNTYIEFKMINPKWNNVYERLKVFKDTKEVIRDNRTGQGNRGFSRLTHTEINILNYLFKEL